MVPIIGNWVVPFEENRWYPFRKLAGTLSGNSAITLAEALKQIRAISKITGIKIVLVDALNESAVSFYKAYGFDELDDDKMKLFMKVSGVDGI